MPSVLLPTKNIDASTTQTSIGLKGWKVSEITGL